MGVAVYHVALCLVKCCRKVGGEALGADYVVCDGGVSDVGGVGGHW